MKMDEEKREENDGSFLDGEEILSEEEEKKLKERLKYYGYI